MLLVLVLNAIYAFSHDGSHINVAANEPQCQLTLSAIA